MGSGHAPFCSLLLLSLLLPVPGVPLNPEMYFNIYRNAPQVRLLKLPVRRLSLQESDRQHQILSTFGTDYTLTGSTFYQPRKSASSLVSNAGILRDLFPRIPRVRRIYAAFSRRGQNYL